jgi:uncharacterized OB-fold protein
VSAPFWAALREERLVAQRCADCEWPVWLPKTRCPRCWSERLEWRELSGAGTLVSFTVVHRPIFPGWAEVLPYVVAVVEPDEHPEIRFVANLYDIESAGVRTGLRVQACALPAGPDAMILGYRPVTP